MERTIAPKRQNIGSPFELARGQSTGGLHHRTTTPPVAISVAFDIFVRSYSNNSAGILLHTDTSISDEALH